MTKRQLVLEDGATFEGSGFGADTDSTGEVVFNTGMTGYQEALTNPSGCGQIVTMTYPLIGNCGINRDDFETVTPFIHGLVVKEISEHPSNFRSDESLHDYLKANDIPGISGIDTRKLTKHIRKYGTMKAMVTDTFHPTEKLTEMVKNMPDQTDQVKTTSTVKPYVVPGRGKRIVLMDLGMKHSILRELTKRNCHITVVPYDYSAENILRLKPDGIMLTNGPGNPKNVTGPVAMIKSVLGKIPLFGVCLGHQLFALACGADTEKMALGHRGANQPVKDMEKNKTFMTSQNHSYAIVHESLTGTELELTQFSLNDNSVEGIRHKKYPAFSVQYHPEGSPGPEDTLHLFDDFIQMISESKQKENAYA
ncbi:carbamoyl-phosphate synthase small chain [Lentibacillus kapialis]|uniref:Carbamoyl phosphate synthase small chain n=1 Tax=Lentibacillus kapialis TaxID=340214 RepID=A0A917UUC2_9BACI|nr:carbamoyl phosphate synthase small subunit [Lentibacillus kapialis]GGJ86516.1 carbamoyl-phosphate synthase small chain [Lentibacillus kapialis]